MTTLKKGTRLYHIALDDIPQLKKIPTYFALTPLNAICMAPVDKSAKMWEVNFRKPLYVLTLSEDTTFFSDQTLNYIGTYMGNDASNILQVNYGYRLQELIIQDPTIHKWEKVTDTAGVMPSVQLFLAKYPIWEYDFQKPLQRTLERISFNQRTPDVKYDFYESQWNQMEINFKMKMLEELDEAQKTSIENENYWWGVNKQYKMNEVKRLVNFKMSLKQQLGSWEDFSREKLKYVRLHKAGSMVPKHLVLDIQSPKEYIVITTDNTPKKQSVTVPSSTEYIAKINELKSRIRQLNKLIRDLENEYDDNFDKETEKRLQTLEDERRSLMEERKKLIRKEKERKAAIRDKKSTSLKLKF